MSIRASRASGVACRSRFRSKNRETRLRWGLAESASSVAATTPGSVPSVAESGGGNSFPSALVIAAFSGFSGFSEFEGTGRRS
jgi:hypothetical protein